MGHKIAYEREKRKILLTYILVMAFFLTILAVGLVTADDKRSYLRILITVLITAVPFTIVFILSYRDPARWGWLLYGRRRMMLGNPWESRIRRDLVMMEARQIAEEEYEYQRSINYERPEGFDDVTQMRSDIRRMHKNQGAVGKDLPGDETYGEDVLFCPQCGTAFVFDPDDRQCATCGTYLHDGKKLLFTPTEKKQDQ